MTKEEEPAAPMAFEVRRQAPELVRPAAETPRETKPLSAIDNANRMLYPMAFFFRGGGGADQDHQEEPASVIRRALGEALVHYYPLAGRVRESGEGASKHLVVDCTGEGVLFVEADADVRLADLEAAAGGLRPPFPWWDQLLHAVEGSSEVLDSPLLLIQVTRLLCGGFVFALRFNHTLCDGIGIAHFINAMGELARGVPSIAVTPVWRRELVMARDPPTPSSILRGFNKNVPPPAAAGDMDMADMLNRSFTFRSSDLVAIRKSLPPPLCDTATTFEVLSALLWRARAAALQVKPGTSDTLVFPANVRGAAHMGLPKGYYGCATIPSTVQADAEVLLGGTLGEVVELIRRHKATVDTEYVRSLVDELVHVGGQWIWQAGLFYLSDFRRVGLNSVDFGWGVPVFAGPVETYFGLSPVVAVKEDGREEDLLFVPVTLPRQAMDRFAAEVESYVS